jgi:hypothetical protein
MGDYQRTTRTCTIESMTKSLSTELIKFIEKNELDIDTATPLICIETTSTKLKKKLFSNKPEVIQAGILLNPKWLLLVVSNENGKLGVAEMPLREIQATDYEKSDFYKLIPDNGVTITGLRTGDAGSGSIFIGLGPEEAAQEFRSQLKNAIANAH